MNLRRDLKSFDYVLFGLVIGLVCFGVLMVGSATGLGNGTISGTFKSQIMFAVTGVVIMLAAAFIDYEFICKFYIPIYVINIILLVLVLFIGSGKGVARWIELPISNVDTKFTIQPSEFTKIFMIVYLAKLIDKYKESINNIGILCFIVLLSVVPIMLIVIQPSLSASIVPLIILAVMLYVGRISYKYIIGPLVIISILAFLFYLDLHNKPYIFIGRLLDYKILQSYQVERVWYFFYPELNPDKAYQNLKALAALSSGLLTGKGLFHNEVVVPAAANDFIFSIVGAEFGFLGTVALTALMVLVVFKCILIANRSDVFVGRLMASGVAAIIAFQTFSNIAVNIGLMPNTGIVFPFISSGGSSLWICMGCIGLVLNVGMTRSKSLFED